MEVKHKLDCHFPLFYMDFTFSLKKCGLCYTKNNALKRFTCSGSYGAPEVVEPLNPHFFMFNSEMRSGKFYVKVNSSTL